MHAAFQNAATPEPFRVMGRKMQPFCIGHQILLERFESPYAVGSSNDKTWDEFLFAVWVCSHTYQDFVKSLSSVFTGLRVKLWSFRCGKFDVGEAQTYFDRYLSGHTAEPVYFFEENHGCREIGMPWGQYLKMSVQEKLGLTEMEAVDFPYRQAQLFYLSQLSERSVINFATERDMQLFEMAKRSQPENN